MSAAALLAHTAASDADIDTADVRQSVPLRHYQRHRARFTPPRNEIRRS